MKYNKIFQNDININIINYKLFTGSYIVYEENGKVKEYDDYSHDLRFEGEDLNGIRNGKGKEYNIFFGGLIFEGEYLNGKRNGKGYYENNIIYELKNGKGHIKE